MVQAHITLLFALLRSGLTGNPLSEEEKALYSPDCLDWIFKAAKVHSLAHLVGIALQANHLADEQALAPFQREIHIAVFQHEQMQYTLNRACQALESAAIPFVPLKGSVIRKFYPQSWMRTSCDIDIFVREADLENAVTCLERDLHGTRGKRDIYDWTVTTPDKIPIELHFHLTENRKNCDSTKVLKRVWDHVHPCDGWTYRYEMSPAFFSFHHITHMVKHFEDGGCGIRPLMDLWILEQAGQSWQSAKDFLQEAHLWNFAQTMWTVTQVWFEGKPPTLLTQKVECFILRGGVYGSVDNRVALNQQTRGGKGGYLLSRIFAPMEKLKLYFPILEKYPWLMPVMQVRRWFLLRNPRVFRMAQAEIAANRTLSADRALQMHRLLKDVGL